MSSKDSVHLHHAWASVLRHVGVHPENVLRSARLPPVLAQRRAVRISTDEYLRLWESVEAESDPAVALRIGEAMPTTTFHPALFAALLSPNLSMAVRRMARYKRLTGPLSLDVEETDQGLYVGILWHGPMVELPRTLASTELVLLTHLARIATRTHIHPLRVETPYDLQPRAVYERWFGVALERSSRLGLTFSQQDAELPFSRASDGLFSSFDPALRRRLADLEERASPSQKVSAALLEALPCGEASIESVSRRLGTGVRTLQRHLKQEHTSFKAIVNQTREKLAHHYLKDPGLAYSEIALLVGFDEPSSFFRAFREWTGRTPETVRMELNSSSSQTLPE